MGTATTLTTATATTLTTERASTITKDQKQHHEYESQARGNWRIVVKYYSDLLKWQRVGVKMTEKKMYQSRWFCKTQTRQQAGHLSANAIIRVTAVTEAALACCRR